jgi:WD40 repeat protein
VTTGRQIGEPIEHDSPVWTAAFSPDGKKVATGCEDWSANLWNIELSGGQAKLSEHIALRISDGPVWFVSFSGDGNLLGISGQDHTIRILRLKTLDAMFSDPDELEREAKQQQFGISE